MEFLYFLHMVQVKFYTVLTPKMIWESELWFILDKIYLRLHENVL